MEDKFILMGLNNENSKYVADALKSKTCQKILDFLAETKEASEKDISNALNIPLNTVEYNLKKLIKSKLVEKTKNFFWSVKGRKINMYKLAKKYIIISPNKTPSLSYLKKILPVALIVGFFTMFIKYILQITFGSSQIIGKKQFSQNLDTTAVATATKTKISFLTKLITMSYWAYFFIGIILAGLIFLIWKKIKKK